LLTLREAHDFTRCVTRSLVLCVCFVDLCLSFVLFRLAIVLSVLQYTDYDSGRLANQNPGKRTNQKAEYKKKQPIDCRLTLHSTCHVNQNQKTRPKHWTFRSPWHKGICYILVDDGTHLNPSTTRLYLKKTKVAYSSRSTWLHSMCYSIFSFVCMFCRSLFVHGKTVKMFLYFGGRLKLMLSIQNFDIVILWDRKGH
jgi:hypothetical protein